MGDEIDWSSGHLGGCCRGDNPVVRKVGEKDSYKREDEGRSEETGGSVLCACCSGRGSTIQLGNRVKSC